MATDSIPENSTKFTRRAILAGIPASAAVAVVGSSVSASAFSGPDADLLAMMARWEALMGRQVDTQAKADEICYRIRLEVPFPPILKRRLQEAPSVEGVPIHEWKRVPMSQSDIDWRYRNKPGKRMAALSALEAWEEEVKGRLARTEWPALKAEFEPVHAEQLALFDRIMTTRATTPQGMLAKLDAIYEGFDSSECASVYDDLRVLCGLEPSATVEG